MMTSIAYTEDNPDDQGFIVSDAYGFNQAVTTIDSTLPAPVPAPIVVPSDASPLSCTNNDSE